MCPFPADLREALLVGYSDQIRVLLLQTDPRQAGLDFQFPTAAANVTSIAYNPEVGVVWSEDHSEKYGVGVIKVAEVQHEAITVSSLLSVAASSVVVYSTFSQCLVFWVDTGLGVIGAVNAKDKNPYVIFEQGLHRPRALVVYKGKRWVHVGVLPG